ncbi:MAG TPA: hypothetical protein QF564_27990 [Pirellulaceae bacterium]|nr:hypothetical protein [Pirellulaceae bacterium]
MTRPNRHLERMARRMSELFGEAQCSGLSVELPLDAWQECQRLVKLIAKAEARGWLAAARRMHQRFVRAQQALMDRLATADWAIQSSTDDPHRSTATGVYQDLQALQDEFVSIDYDRQSRKLKVSTEEIVFGDLNLGPFEIVLQCDQLSDTSPYQVVALDANPAGTDSETTHPHVQGDALCEGEGRAPIQRALQQRRLYDFFLIVRQILGTYNSSSAYVSIHDWHGTQCRDCGTTIFDGNRDVCSRCETDLCNDCSYCCSGCSEGFCNDCAEVCDGCHEYYCQACLQSCDKCELPFCEDCLTDEKCPKCVEKEEANEKNSSSEADTQVHTDCLGKADLSS